MCYTVSIFANTHEIETDTGATFDNPEAYQPYFHVSGYVHPELPMITLQRPDAIEMFEWGLIPAWIKDSEAAGEIANKTLNARSDTVFEKASFKHAIIRRRSLLPVNGFLEWRHEGDVKQPFLVRGIDSPLITLGCIYQEWTDKSHGEHKRTFSILTTEANELMSYVHNNKLRMPVVVEKVNRSAWLSDIDSNTITALMRPLPENRLEAIPLSKSVSRIKVNADNPELLKPTGKTLLDPVPGNT